MGVGSLFFDAIKTYMLKSLSLRKRCFLVTQIYKNVAVSAKLFGI